MSSPHPDDCLGCAINRIVRKLAKEHSDTRDTRRDASELRKFGRHVALEVKREIDRRTR